MRWEGGRRSGNVEDRRGLRVTRGVAGGGLGTIVLVLVALYFGVDPSTILNTVSPGDGTRVERSNEPRPAAENRLAEFSSVVLADTEDTWGAIFRERGRTYEAPKLVLFTDAVESACGLAGAASGPFYLQRQTRGRVVPDSFTHGTSAQRVSWFRRGFESGDLGRCDTFAAKDI